MERPYQPSHLCPPGFERQYVIEPGDTFYCIAQRFHISMAALAQANPGINPSLIYPGQILCVPFNLMYPSTFLVPATASYTTKAMGSALITRDISENKKVSIIAILPKPGTINSKYTGYLAYINNIGSTLNEGTILSVSKMVPVSESAGSWAATITFSRYDIIRANTRIMVVPSVTNVVPETPGDLIVLDGYFGG